MKILPKLWSDKEIRYQRLQFQETLNVHGIGVEYYPSKRKNPEDIFDFYNDIRDHDVAYKDKFNIRILFESVPSVRTLRNLGWYIEDEELPYIAYIPTEYIDTDEETETVVKVLPVVDDKITLIDNTTDFNPTRSERNYLIKDMVSQGYPNTIYYIAKLVPEYKSLIESDEP